MMRSFTSITHRKANVVACAASCAFAHLEHAGNGKQAWWGMLATHPARRGHRLSLILGAHVLLDMETRFGFRAFMSGVEPGKVSSEFICAQTGMSRGAFAIIACTDPQTLASERMTKSPLWCPRHLTTGEWPHGPQNFDMWRKIAASPTNVCFGRCGQAASAEVDRQVWAGSDGTPDGDHASADAASPHVGF